MDERRKRRRGSETKAVKTKLQKKREPNGDAATLRRFMSFVWKQRGILASEELRLQQSGQNSAIEEADIIIGSV